MSFYHVLPSNAAPNTFPDNHASKFSIPLPNPYNLSGQWEVGLMNMSYTGCVNTFHHDKVEVTRKADFKTRILKTQLPVSWKLAESKTVGEMLTYIRNALTGIVKMDLSQKGICRWEVQSQDIFLMLNLNVAKSVKLEQDVITASDGEVRNWVDINPEDPAPKDACITFIPFSNVTKTIEIKEKDKAMTIQELVTCFNERVPNASLKYLYGELHVTVKEHLILFSPQLREFMNYLQSGIYKKPPNYTFMPSTNVNMKESWTVGVYELGKVEEHTTPLRQTLSLPPFSFKDHKDAVSYMNTHIPQARFSIDDEEYLQLVIEDENIGITFTDTLRDILAFDKNSYNGAGSYKASGPLSLTRRIHYLYVYSSITDYVRIGDTEAPLLAVIPFSNNPRCSILKEEIFKNQMYIPVRHSNISQIDIEIHDDAGELVPFVTEAITSLRLHYREV